MNYGITKTTNPYQILINITIHVKSLNNWFIQNQCNMFIHSNISQYMSKIHFDIIS